MKFWFIAISIALVILAFGQLTGIFPKTREGAPTAQEQQNTIPALLPLGSNITLQKDEEGRTAALLLGIGGEGHIGELLTDTIMVVSFSDEKERADIFSIPRDLAVQNANTGVLTKINALYLQGGNPAFPKPGGVELLQAKIEEIVGFPIHYYVIIDFDALTKVIDIVGGISIPQEENLTDNSFPTTDRGYETFEVERGWRYLSGEEALKYVRTRNVGHGDFDRMRRQHEVLVALKNKVTGLRTLKDLPTILNIYNTLADNFTSNATLGEFQRLLDITNNFSESRVAFHVISNEPGNMLTSSLVDWGGTQAYILTPNAGEENYFEIQKFIRNILEDS